MGSFDQSATTPEMEAAGRNRKMRCSDGNPGTTVMAVVKPSCCWYICGTKPRRLAERMYLPGGKPAKAKTPSASVFPKRVGSGGLETSGEFVRFRVTDARANGCPVTESMTLPLIRNEDAGAEAGGRTGGQAAS